MSQQAEICTENRAEIGELILRKIVFSRTKLVIFFYYLVTA